MEKETPKTEVKKSTKKRTVPQTDIDLGAVVTKATEKWKANRILDERLDSRGTF